MSFVGCSQRTCVVSLTVSYPGSTADIVEEVVAAPIEQQINGIPGVVRIESESKPESYQCWVFFKDVDKEQALAEVQERIGLAEPMLPEVVRQSAIDSYISSAANGPHSEVTISLEDRGDAAEALSALAEKVSIRARDEGLLVDLQTVPGPKARVLEVHYDDELCKKFGVDPHTVGALGGPVERPEDFAERKIKTSLGGEVLLKDVATLIQTAETPFHYRLNLSRAGRIEGNVPKDKSRRDVVARLLKIAEEERQQINGAKSIQTAELPRFGM